MPSTTFAARAGALITVAALTSSLVACGAEPDLKFVAPTMAPQQSIAEACFISGEEVDRLTLETQQKIQQSLEQAGAAIANGQLPSVDALSGTLVDTLTEVESQISNSEVLAAVTRVREAAQGFQQIDQPDSPLGVPGYLASLGTQLKEIAEAGKSLQSLCTNE